MSKKEVSFIRIDDDTIVRHDLIRSARRLGAQTYVDIGEKHEREIWDPDGVLWNKIEKVCKP